MFKNTYPNLNWWIVNQGYIEIGENEFSGSLVRVLDEGGLCWEDENSKSIDKALQVADRWASEEIEDRFDEKPPKRYS